MAEYDRRMQSVGYEVTTITDISEQVFLPFVSFLEQRHKTQLRGIFNDKWKGLMMYGKIVKWWAGGTNGKPKLLFILVHARKPKSKDA